MKWQATASENGERHVIPIDDLRPHTETWRCWCQPTADDGVWVHHSLDKREEFERGERAAS